MSTCDLCSRALSDTAYVCSHCARERGEDLLLISKLADEPAVTIARQSRHGDGGKASDGQPLPVDLVAARRAAAVENTVATWARHVSETRGLEITTPDPTQGPPCGKGWCRHESCRAIRRPAPSSEMGLAAAWLAQPDQLRWLRHRREAREAFDGLRAAVGELQSIAGGPLPRWYAGQCWEMVADEKTGETNRCETDLYAAPGATTVRCPVCKTVFDAAQRKEWLLQKAIDWLAHAELIARALTALGIENVTSSRIRGLAHRGRLMGKGEDHAGRPLYRVGDVLDLLEAQAQIEEDKRRRREAKQARHAEKTVPAGVA